MPNPTEDGERIAGRKDRTMPAGEREKRTAKEAGRDKNSDAGQEQPAEAEDPAAGA